MALLLLFMLAGCGGGGSDDTGHWDPGDPTSAPTVTFTTPVSDATGVATNTQVSATFSEAMDPLTLNTGTFTLKQGATVVAGAVSYSGVTAVFTPAGDLAASTTYTATVTTVAKDLDGSALANNYVWSFTTGAAPDITAPTVTLTAPVSDATAVLTNSKVSATFSEAMDPLSLTNLSFTLQQGVTVVPGTVVYSGVTAVFTPAGDLAASTTYTATVTTVARDLAGNALANNYVWSFTTGAAPDITAPTVTLTAPGSDATAVLTNSKVSATFSEAMDPLSLTNLSFTLKQGATVVPGTVVYSGVTAVFTPAGALAASTTYTATVTNVARDLAGNALANNYVWSFTTGAAPDITAPTVTLTAPVSDATAVLTNSKVSATFSEAMDPLSLTNLSFTLKQGATVVPGTVVYSGVTAIFTPAGALAASTTYTATVTTVARDLAGNALANNYVWSFTTSAAPDITAPTVTLTAPVSDATAVLTNSKVSATFSEAMDPLSLTNLSFTLKQGATVVPGTVSYSGVTAVFTPAGALAASTTYTATVTTVARDLAGNALANNYVWSFTTGAAPDTTAPTVTLTAPVSDAMAVPTNTQVSATFSEAMDPLTLTNLSFTLKQGATVIPGTVSYSGVDAVFTPSGNLAAGTTYTATITIVARDLAGNALANNYVWSFTTESNVIIPPVNLGLISTFGTFGGTAGMTNTGVQTVINGDIGTTATGTSNITGFRDATDDYTITGANNGLVTGTIYTCAPSTASPFNQTKCDIATQARSDAVDAYNFLAAMPSGGVLAGNLAGTTIYPGVYTSASSVKIEGGDLTLDGGGDSNAVFVFQIGSTLTVGGPGAAFPQNVHLQNGANAKNVYWQVGTSATINAAGGGTMQGTIIANSGVMFSTAGNTNVTTLNGRAVSLISSVTMVDTVINVPSP